MYKTLFFSSKKSGKSPKPLKKRLPSFQPKARTYNDVVKCCEVYKYFQYPSTKSHCKKVKNLSNYRSLNAQIEAVWFELVLRLLAKYDIKSCGLSTRPFISRLRESTTTKALPNTWPVVTNRKRNIVESS